MSGSVQSPLLEAESTILGKFLSLYTVVLLFASGGFYILFETFLFSYQVWPVTTYFPVISTDMSFYFLRLLDTFMYLILLIAARKPISSLPVKGIASILILTFYITKIADYLKELFTEYPASFYGLENLFR